MNPNQLFMSGKKRVPVSLARRSVRCLILVCAAALLWNAPVHATQVFSWGRDYYGQLNVPPNLTNATAISAGYQHCLALKSDGSVSAWGQNTNGQLNFPAAISNNVVAIRAGYSHSLAQLTDGSLVGWGAGQTNTGSGYEFGQSIIPTNLTNVIAFDAGGYFSVALLADGTVTAWGRNNSGETNVPAGLTNVAAISAGGFYCLALKGDGTVVAWGSNTYGQSSVPAGLSNVVAIVASTDNSYAILGDGSLVVWGDNLANQSIIPGDVTNVVMASAGAYHSEVVLETGIPRTWGSYDSTLPAGLTNHAIAISGGFYMGLGLTNDGSPVVTVQPCNRRIFAGAGTVLRALVAGEPPMTYQWSFNGAPIADATNAMLTIAVAQTNDAGSYSFTASNGIGSAASSNASVVVVQQPPVLTTQAGNAVTYRYGPATFTSAAIGSLPLFFQWQLNGTNVPNATNAILTYANVSPGQTGTYSVVVSNAYGVAVSSNAYLTIVNVRDSGYTVPASLTNAVAIAAGDLNGMALKQDNTLLVWGDNTYKQTIIPAAATNIMAIAAGGRTCAIVRSNGTVLMWGDAYEFNGYSGKTNPPPSATNIMAVAVGQYHCLGLRKNGTVVGWGRSNEGQTNVPPSCTNIMAIAVGAYHSLALRSNGTVVAWGQGTSGQTNIPSNITNVIAIAAANNHNYALKADGSSVVWGDTLASFPPTAVAVATSWSSGSRYFSNIRADGTVFSSFLGGVSNAIALAAGGAHNLVLLGDGSPYLYGPPNGWPVAHPGDTVSTRVNVSGTGPIYYQWQLNGTNISGATNATLTLTNIPIMSAGVYSCLISNTLGVITSPGTALGIQRNPLLFTATNNLTQMTPNGFQLHIAGLAGDGPVTVYSSTNLADWTPVLTNPPTVGTLDVVDPNATNQPLLFYKASEGP